MIFLLGLAGIVVVVLVVTALLALRRRRQRAELQDHFHSAYDEGARWNSLGDTGESTD